MVKATKVASDLDQNSGGNGEPKVAPYVGKRLSESLPWFPTRGLPTWVLRNG